MIACPYRDTYGAERAPGEPVQGNPITKPFNRNIKNSLFSLWKYGLPLRSFGRLQKLYNRRFPIKYSAAPVKGTVDANLSTHCREIVAHQSASYAQV